MNDSIVKDIISDLGQKEKKKKVIKEDEKKIFNLESEIDSNIRSLFHIKSTVEDNRNMIISNYISAFNANTNLAKENTRNVFKNKASLLSRIIVNDENEELYIDLQKDRMKLEYFSHLIEVNKKNLEILTKIAEANTQLIQINKQIMELNKYIVEFNKKNIESNKEMMKSDFECPEVSQETLNNQEKDNIKVATELEKKSKGNQEKIKDLSKKSDENNTSILKNRNLILQRRDSIVSNSDSIEVNKSKIFYNI